MVERKKNQKVIMQGERQGMCHGLEVLTRMDAKVDIIANVDFDNDVKNSKRDDTGKRKWKRIARAAGGAYNDGSNKNKKRNFEQTSREVMEQDDGQASKKCKINQKGFLHSTELAETGIHSPLET